MGGWAKTLFGQETFSDIGIVVAGVSNQEFEKEILTSFDDVLFSKDLVYHTHLVKKNGILYPIVFNVYGAPAMLDVLTPMHDGGCRNIIFVGEAYGGFKNLDIGKVVIPYESHHFDGTYYHIDPKHNTGTPNKQLKEKLESLFEKHNIDYTTGINISVTAVTLQPLHANEEYQRIQPSTLEMELSACYSRSRDIGIRAVGVLIVSDNKSSSINDTLKRELCNSMKINVLKTVIENLSHLRLPPLQKAEEFSINQYLAKVIEDPEDRINVYRSK